MEESDFPCLPHHTTACYSKTPEINRFVMISPHGPRRRIRARANTRWGLVCATLSYMKYNMRAQCLLALLVPTRGWLDPRGHWKLDGCGKNHKINSAVVRTRREKPGQRSPTTVPMISSRGSPHNHAGRNESMNPSDVLSQVSHCSLKYCLGRVTPKAAENDSGRYYHDAYSSSTTVLWCILPYSTSPSISARAIRVYHT